jgi:prepilin-type N-terminal cleavage/methylation domain-containing protein
MSKPFNRLPAAEKAIHGFTLLEILLAMFILSFVVSLVFGSFNSIFSSADHVNINSDLIEMGDACLNHMKADLESVHVSLHPRYKPPDIDDEPELYRFEGKEEMIGGNSFAKLRFTSLAHLPLNHQSSQGIAEIVYYVISTDDAGFVLKRSDHLYPYPEFKENPLDPSLCEQVRTFKVVYYDQKGDERDAWDSESDDFDYNTPGSVSIQLSLGNEENNFEFKTELLLPMQRQQPEKK